MKSPHKRLTNENRCDRPPFHGLYIFLAAGLFLLGLGAGTLIGWAGRAPKALGAPSTFKGWSEKNSGVIPQVWGDLVGVANQNLQTVLIFRDVKGTLRRVQWNANGSVSKLVHVLRREL